MDEKMIEINRLRGIIREFEANELNITKKINTIYDSFMDELNENDKTGGSKKANEYIYKTQDFIFNCLQHKILSQEEYEKLYIRLRNCISKSI